MKFLIDGIDRLGKSTLIEHIQNRLGYHLVVHYDKPKVLDSHLYYKIDGRETELPTNAARQIFQEEANKYMFELLKTNIPLIFDRTHLGELVYAPIYREYSGDYVLKLETNLIFNRPNYAKDTRLILLTTSDFSIMKDDGGGYDWNRKEEEQARFIEAFDRSMLKNKIIIDVADPKGGYKNPYDILNEALSEKIS